MKTMTLKLLAALTFAVASMAVAASGGKGKAPDPGAAAVIVDANGEVVGPLVWLPNDPGPPLYYGAIGAAYRVSDGEVARVGFLPSPGPTFGLLSRVYRAANVYFAASNCTGQAYATEGLPANYKPYAPVFVVPPLEAGGAVIPTRVMRQTTQTQQATALSVTNDDAICNPTYVTTEFTVIETIGDFPFTAPFSIR